MRLNLACVLGLFWLGTFFTQAQEPPPVQITAELGFSNLYPASRPFPIQIDVSDAKILIEGSMKITAADFRGAESIYEVPLSITPGSRKRWKLVLPPLSNNSVSIEIVDRKGRSLSKQTFFGIVVDTDQTTTTRPESLLLVVQENGGNRFVFPREDQEQESQAEFRLRKWRTASVPPESLPENTLAYAGVSAVLWRSERPTTLTDPQARALVDWLKRGGILIVAGGKCEPPNLGPHLSWPNPWGEFSELPLNQLQGVPLEPAVRPLHLAIARKTNTWKMEGSSNAIIAIKPLVCNASDARFRSGETPLIVETIIGGGVLTQLAFDPSDFSKESIKLGREFWEQILTFSPAQSIWVESFTWLNSLASDLNHSQLAELANFRVASLSEVSLVFGAFFGLAFCLNFWLFRKSRRYEWAWLILLVASIGLFFYNRAFGRVGALAPTRHFEITKSMGVAGEKGLLSFSEIGLLSPRTRTELIHSQNDAQFFFSANPESRLIRVEENKQISPMQIKAASFSTCASVAWTELPAKGISFHWEEQGENINIILTNETGLTLSSPMFRMKGGGIRFIQNGNQFSCSIPIADLNRNFALINSDPDQSYLNSSNTSNVRSASRRVIYSYDNQTMANTDLVFSFQVHDGFASQAQSSVEAKISQEVTLILPIPITMITELSQPSGGRDSTQATSRRRIRVPAKNHVPADGEITQEEKTRFEF